MRIIISITLYTIGFLACIGSLIQALQKDYMPAYWSLFFGIGLVITAQFVLAFMERTKNKLLHCPHGYVDWDDCPICGH